MILRFVIFFILLPKCSQRLRAEANRWVGLPSFYPRHRKTVHNEMKRIFQCLPHACSLQQDQAIYQSVHRVYNRGLRWKRLLPRNHDRMFKELTCNECGAAPKGMKQCHELFDDLLGIKYLGDGEAYRLAIACYTFQHPHSHTSKAWHYAHAYLSALVHDNLPSKQARQEANQNMESRNPAMLDRPPPHLHHRIPWSQNIVNFSNEVQKTPTETALTWARSLLHTYEEWLHRST